MLDNQINELMANAIERIRGMMDVNTVIGVPFETKDGKILEGVAKGIDFDGSLKVLYENNLINVSTNEVNLVREA